MVGGAVAGATPPPPTESGPWARQGQRPPMREEIESAVMVTRSAANCRPSPGNTWRPHPGPGLAFPCTSPASGATATGPPPSTPVTLRSAGRQVLGHSHPAAVAAEALAQTGGSGHCLNPPRQLAGRQAENGRGPVHVGGPDRGQRRDCRLAQVHRLALAFHVRFRPPKGRVALFVAWSTKGSKYRRNR